MNQLTAIIPFLNEGAEIERTVASIRDTAGDAVDILLINDCSQDDTDYETVAKQYNARYHHNTERQGVARSRDIGVELCETPYFILFDGHMRFYHNNWWTAVTEALDNNDRAVYCLKCYPLNEQFELIKTETVGATIKMDENAGGAILDAEWNYTDNTPDEPLTPIPCVLGACYALSKRYWHHLKGLTGLRTYGSDEAYLSLKTWLEGGKCILMKEIHVGHIFRSALPYPVPNTDTIYNKLLIAETILPVAYKNRVFHELRRSNEEEYNKAFQLLCENRQLVAELKEYYKEIFTCNVETFIEPEKGQDVSLPVYVINLPERLDRRQHTEEQFLNKSEFELVWVDAISHPIGAVGLWQSIVKAVKMAMERDDDVMIICEDDHEFTSAYNKDYLFANIAASHEQGAELLSGGIGGFGTAVSVAPNRYWVDWLWCLQFTVIFKPLFQKILDYDFKDTDTTDGALSAIAGDKMVMYPFISIQKDFGYSDVTSHNNSPGAITNFFREADFKMGMIHHIAHKFKEK